MKKFLPVLSVLLFCAAGVFFLSQLDARPGGGSSYSSGSHSSSSHSSGGSHSYSSSSGGGGGGGDGGALVEIAIWLLLEHPKIGLPLVIVLVIVYFVSKRGSPSTVITSHAPPPVRREKRIDAAAVLPDFRKKDPNFSRILFLDFVQALYMQMQEWRSKKEIAQLSPFIAEGVLTQLQNSEKRPIDVDEIVIGSIDIREIRQTESSDQIAVDISANYTETFTPEKGEKSSIRFIVVERWLLDRKKGTMSPEPEKMKKLSCPACGASLELDEFGKCKYCGTKVEAGTQHWRLAQRSIVSHETRKSQSIGIYEEERGTDWPTVFSPTLEQEVETFKQTHQIADWNSFYKTFSENVVSGIFENLYESWASQNWEKARPVMTDRLFQSHNYWINEYRAAGVMNRLENRKIQRIELVKIETDKFYETVTVRIHASMLDYAVDRSGKIIGGSRTKPRDFTEYWSFVRSRKAVKKEDQFNADACPNCGAPIKMGMTGVCEYCNSKVSEGDFNWVLALIIQDEVYGG